VISWPCLASFVGALGLAAGITNLPAADLSRQSQTAPEKVVLPKGSGGAVISRGEPVAETMEKADDLRTYSAGLRAKPDIRVICNQDDFLLSDEDLVWLRATFTPEQLTVFNRGGHLGNLTNPTVQKTILAALAGLKPFLQK